MLVDSHVKMHKSYHSQEATANGTIEIQVNK